MRTQKVFLPLLALLTINFAIAQDVDVGTFPIEGGSEQIQKEELEQLEMQREEEEEYDAFGEEEFNQNVDPDSYEGETLLKPKAGVKKN
jgi:ABC-type microcin C transport system permease subunit YejB